MKKINHNKLTDKQKKLIEDNLPFMIRWFHMHNIYDEDLQQDMLYNLCLKIPLYDSDKGTITTFMSVCNESRRLNQYKHSNRYKEMFNNLMLRFSDTAYIDSGGNIVTWEEIIGDYCIDFDEFETTDLYNYIKHKLEKCDEITEEDYKIFIAYLKTANQTQVAKMVGLSRQTVNKRIQKIRRIIKTKRWLYG